MPFRCRTGGDSRNATGAPRIRRFSTTRRADLHPAAHGGRDGTSPPADAGESYDIVLRTFRPDRDGYVPPRRKAVQEANESLNKDGSICGSCSSRRRASSRPSAGRTMSSPWRMRPICRLVGRSSSSANLSGKRCRRWSSRASSIFSIAYPAAASPSSGEASASCSEMKPSEEQEERFLDFVYQPIFNHDGRSPASSCKATTSRSRSGPRRPCARASSASSSWPRARP